MARIVLFHEVGGPEVLKIEDAEVPPPRKGEVRIKVKVLGLNRAESMFRSGHYIMNPVFPSRLGYEASGIVEAIGPDVTGITPGDSVSVIPSTDQGKYGVYGEIATVQAKFVVKNPPGLSYEDGAASWMQYMTAYGALVDIASVKKGDFVAIPAASSSVGLAAIQICKMFDAIPIAITRTSEKKEALLKAGAAHVIVSQKENLVKRLQEITKGVGTRIAFDPVGGKTILELAEGMANEGILFQYGALSPDPTPFPLFTAILKSLTVRGYGVFELYNDKTRFENGKKFILKGLQEKKLKPIIDKVFALKDIVEAHRYLESNVQFGKILVTVP